MSHSGIEHGTTDDWKPIFNPSFKCRHCGASDAKYRTWESSCGGWEDYNYHCNACNREWWVDGIDS